MPQAKPGIATTILAPEQVGEGIVEISQNKTLFIQKLTQDGAEMPEIVSGLQTVEAVFDHFKPSCAVELEKEDGSTVEEEFNFNGLGDFDVKSLIKQSPFLTKVNVEHDVFLKMVKQLGTNKSLKSVIDNPDTKKAFINSLRALVLELEDE